MVSIQNNKAKKCYIGSKPRVKKLLLLTSINILLLTSFAFASPTEYLFKEESLGQKDMIVEIGGREYNIYKIDNSREGTILVINTYGDLPSDEILQKSIITYYTYFYVKDNENAIDPYFHSIANKLDDKAKSDYQKILDTFKSLSEKCIDIPQFKLLQICVKPTDKLKIMQVDIGIVGMLPDWKVALSNYKSLGGNILYFRDKSGTMKYSFTEEVYKDIIATYYFLSAAESITGEKFIESDVLKPEKIASEVGRNTKDQFDSIKNRVSKLKESERTKFKQVKFKINEIDSVLKSITRINGNLNDGKIKNNELNDEVNLISLNDQKFSTDIDKLDNILVRAEELKKQVENSYSNRWSIYQKKNFIEKFIDDIIGWIRSSLYWLA